MRPSRGRKVEGSDGGGTCVLDETGESNLQPVSADEDLVDLIYAATLDPNRYDELVSRWQQHLDGAIDQPASTELAWGDSSIGTDEITRHFDRAFAIMERMGRREKEGFEQNLLVGHGSRPAMLVGQDGRIRSVNERAMEQFGIVDGDPIEKLDLEAQGLANLRRALAGMGQAPTGRLLTLCRARTHDGATPVLVLSRVDGSAEQGPTGLVTIADIGWSDRVGAMLSEVFGLTPAECSVASSVIGGHSSEAIAAQRGRSVETVRTQLKSILGKLGVRTQAELVRMVAALLQIDQEPDLSDLRDIDPVKARVMLTRPRGRLLEIAAIGPDNGRPVIFIHGMLDDYGVTQALLQGLHAQRIRLIAPVRPWFGASGPDKGPVATAPQRFADDLAAVLDHFGIEACPVVGHLAGSVYAFAAAGRLGARITRIVSISGGVPILSIDHFAKIAPRQRTFSYTARFTPQLLPMLVRTGVALIDNGGFHRIVEAMHHASPVDLATARTPEIFELICQGYRFTVAQGHRAFVIDAHHVVRDWSEYVKAGNQPVTLLHGAHDPVVPIDAVRSFDERLGARSELIELPDHGQLLLHSAPKRVLEVLEKALSASPE